jgi:SWI/SNF-related matrix-associated actin-dependent regulator of chromatin subfamily D
VRETLRAGEKLPRLVRLYVWNTSQPALAPGEAPSWTLHIHGKLLDAPGAPAAPAPGQPAAPPQPGVPQPPTLPAGTRVTSLFRSVSVRLDPARYPGDAGSVTWHRDAAGTSGLTADGWEVKRPVSGSVGDATPVSPPGGVTAVITLEPAHAPARQALPPALARLLGVQTCSRTALVHALWSRARTTHALSSDDPTDVRVDAPLADALGLAPASVGGFAKFGALVERAVSLLTPVGPFTFTYTIRTDGGARAGADVYDISLDVPDPRGAEMSALVQRHSRDQAVAEYDARIGVQLTKIGDHKRRRAFLMGFAASPADFLNAIIASQARDLELVGGGAVRAREAERRAEFYRQPWVEDAVMHFLQRRSAAGAP